jgi:hypothetical protein
MDTKQKEVKGKDKTANQLMDNKSKNMSNQKTTNVNSDEKKNIMKKDEDKKTVSSHNK